MIEKLTIEHLVPYLSYGLKMRFQDTTGREITLTGITYTGYGVAITGGHGSMWLNNCRFKPLLRPLSHLTKEITHGEDTFIMMDRLFEIEWPSKPKGNSPYYYNDAPNFINIHHHNPAANTKILKNQMLNNPYWMIQELFKYHFDVFGLLASGLALPIE